MSRNEETKPNLDELVRRKVTGEYEVPFQEEDWHAMERSLKTRELHRSRVKRWRWVAAASLLIAAVLGVAALQNHFRLTEISRQLAEDTVQIQPHVPLLPVPERRDPLLPSDSNGGMAEIRESDPGSTPPNPTGSPATPSIVDAEEVAGDHETWPLETSRSGLQAFLRAEAPTPVTLATVQGTERLAPPVRPVASLEREDRLQTEYDPVEGDLFGRTATDPRAVRGLSLGLVLAPDVSMAGGMPGFQSPGVKAGLTLDLGLGSGLSLQTGVIYSGVRYTGEGGLYNPNGYSYGAVAGPESLHAVCHLLDIPLSLRVRLHEGDRGRIVAGAGVSSYIMLNERYRFDYAQSAPGQLREWEGNTGTRHWASHASLSVGYELSLVPGWSLRAEPYLRLPIRNVGRANVKLYSVGTLFSLTVDL